MKANALHIVGVPLDHGAGRRGVGMGPSSIRIAGLHAAIKRLGYEIVDHGDLNVPAPETRASEGSNAKYLSVIDTTCRELSESVQGVLREDGFPLVIGGDHSIAIGTISGISAHLQREDPKARLGVIWFDAHGDINTPETSPSGNIHGMPVACLLGNGPETLTSIGHAGPKLNPATFVQIGLRDIDAQERRLLKEAGTHAFTMTDIDKRGMSAVMQEAIAIACQDTDYLHVSFDIDSIDPKVAPGTGTQKSGGLTYREAHLACEMIAETERMRSMEMVEVNPTLDLVNQTSIFAVELIASALGQRIL